MKTILSLFASVLILASSCLPVLAEDLKVDADLGVKKTEHPVQYSALGASAGFISGVGFSYREYLTERIGYKVSAVVYIDNYLNFMNGGLQGIYVLSDNDWMRFYAIGGVADFNYRRKNTIYDPMPAPTGDATKDALIKESKPREVLEVYNYFNFGGGIGMEIGRSKRNLSLSIELPLAVGIKDFKTIEYTLPIPQISLLYNF